MLFLILAISIVSTFKIEVTEFKEIIKRNNENPGIKISIPQSTIQYIAVQIIPYFKEQFQHMTFPDIHTDISTPIGKITLDVTEFKLDSFDLSTPVVTIVAGNEWQFDDPSVSATANAHWHYKQHGFPYVSDSGTFDLKIDISLTIQTGAVIDASQKSGIKVKCNNLDIGYNKFDLTMHGGASWLYNLLIGALKGTIESTIRDEVKKEVPPVLQDQMQHSLDSVDLNIEVFEGIFFNFQPDDIIFDTTKKFLGLGVKGNFYKDGIAPYPGTPKDMPDISTTPEMIMIFISDYSMDTAGWVTDKAGILAYTLTNKDIPPEWPIKMNTSYFEELIPNLYKLFPNKEMQITFEADPDTSPTATFDASGLTLLADADIIFQVVNDTEKNDIVDAFTLEMKLVANGSVSIGSKENTQYIIKGNVGEKSMDLTCKQTIIGPIEVKDIEETMQFLVQKLLLPIINKMLDEGIPLPDIPYFELKNPDISYHDGYLEVRSDFTFTPPSI